MAEHLNNTEKGEQRMHQAIEASTFEVTEVPIKYEGLVNAEDYKFIVNTKTCKVISCMTKDYRLVSNQEVIDKSLPHIEKRGGVLPNVKCLVMELEHLGHSSSRIIL